MEPSAALASTVSLMWLTVAILAGGYARSRNRSAWTWFVLTVFLGPLAAYLLVVWPAREPKRPAQPRDTIAGAGSADTGHAGSR